MVASLTLCVPQGFPNPFFSFAMGATLAVALLALCAALLWLFLRRHFFHVHDGLTWILHGTAILAAALDIPAAGVAAWIWLQALRFIPWCAPTAVAVLDAQDQRVDTAFLACVTTLAIAIVLLAVSGLLIAVGAVVSAATRAQTARSV